jgi:sigma-B regulation protein RsbU (phosphoserine phosphatase)
MFEATPHPRSHGMSRKKRFFLKFSMGGANFLANLVGVAFAQGVSIWVERPLPDFVWTNPLVDLLEIAFSPMAFAFISVATVIYERPLHRYVDALFERRPVAGPQAEKARRRLLNEPYMTMALDLSMWSLAALLYGLVFWQAGAGSIPVRRTVYNSLSVGLITITVAFFLQEHVLQKHLAPHFFPQGGLSAVPGARRIRIGTRLAALLLASNLLPLLSILLLYWRIVRTHTEPQTAIDIMGPAIRTYALVFIAVGVVLTILVVRNLSRPFTEIIDTLHEIRNGRFDQKVRVTTNDEIGFTGDAINEMTAGLKEREHMRRSLALAMEVQQNLLPKAPPHVAGLDITGTSIYCEETGGDYFDYLPDAESGDSAIRVVVGDVSDHGVPSAMLMTSVRAFLRQRAARRGSLAEIVADVNRQIARDVEDTGRFATLFLAEIDPIRTSVRWVNAGHDPAVIFDPRTDAFIEMGRTGLPVGVSAEADYHQRHMEIASGQIIVIGTDGIWEARNSLSEMFGKRRFQEIIRRTAQAASHEILEGVVREVREFCYPLRAADDITLVVIKVDA